MSRWTCRFFPRPLSVAGWSLLLAMSLSLHAQAQNQCASNASPTNPGDNIYVTGNTVELSNWASTTQNAVGAMLTTAGTYPNWWLNVSVPAGTTIQYKFIKIQSNGTVTWENGANHSYTVPASGVGSVNVNWQY